jgi:hypothetical protein
VVDEEESDVFRGQRTFGGPVDRPRSPGVDSQATGRKRVCKKIRSTNDACPDALKEPPPRPLSNPARIRGHEESLDLALQMFTVLSR